MKKAYRYLIFLSIYAIIGVLIFYGTNYLIKNYIANKKCGTEQVLDGNICREKCDGSKTYYIGYGCMDCPIGKKKNSSGICVPDVCGEGYEMCGDSCIVTATEQCLYNKTSCLKDTDECKHLYKDKNGKQACCEGCVVTKDGKDTCCKKIQYANTKTGKCEKCKDSKQVCGDKCCPNVCNTANNECCEKGEKLTKSGCCMHSHTYKLNDEESYVCCENGFSGKDNRCCTNVESLDPATNKCGVKCGKDGDKQVYCFPKNNIGVKQGEERQVCFKTNFGAKDGGKEVFACVNDNCKTKVEPQPNPPNFYTKTNASNTRTDGLPVCEKDGKYWFCKQDKLTPNLSSTTRKISAKFDDANCTNYNCFHTLQDWDGVENVTYKADTGDCEANDICEDILPDCGSNDVNYMNSSITENSISICRTSDNTPTGQICKNNEICDIDGDSHVCIKGYTLNQIDPKTGDSTVLDKSKYTNNKYTTTQSLECKRVMAGSEQETNFDTKEKCENMVKSIGCGVLFDNTWAKNAFITSDPGPIDVYGRRKDKNNKFGCYREMYNPNVDNMEAEYKKAASTRWESGSYNPHKAYCHWNGFAFGDEESYCYPDPGGFKGSDGKIPYGAHVCYCPGTRSTGAGWGRMPSTSDSVKQVCKTSNFDNDKPGAGYSWYQCTNPDGCTVTDDIDDTTKDFCLRYNGNNGGKGGNLLLRNFCAYPDNLDIEVACPTCAGNECVPV